MKIVGLTWILVSLIILSKGQSANTDPILVALENKFLEVLKNRTFENLASFYDDAYQGTLETGRVVDKNKMIEFQKTVSPYITPSIEDLKTAVYTEIAITTGRLVNKTKSGTIIGQSRFIRVYVKRNNEWKIIEGQYTLIEQ